MFFIQGRDIATLTNQELSAIVIASSKLLSVAKTEQVRRVQAGEASSRQAVEEKSTPIQKFQLRWDIQEGKG